MLAINDSSLGDTRAGATTAFVVENVFYAHDITVLRIMTDNGSCYRSKPS